MVGYQEIQKKAVCNWASKLRGLEKAVLNNIKEDGRYIEGQDNSCKIMSSETQLRDSHIRKEEVKEAIN